MNQVYTLHLSRRDLCDGPFMLALLSCFNPPDKLDELVRAYLAHEKAASDLPEDDPEDRATRAWAARSREFAAALAQTKPKTMIDLVAAVRWLDYIATMGLTLEAAERSLIANCRAFLTKGEVQ